MSAKNKCETRGGASGGGEGRVCGTKKEGVATRRSNWKYRVN